MTDLLAELLWKFQFPSLSGGEDYAYYALCVQAASIQVRGLEFFSEVFSWEKRWKGVVDLNKRNGKVTTKVVVSKQFFECLLLTTWGDFFCNLT